MARKARMLLIVRSLAGLVLAFGCSDRRQMPTAATPLPPDAAATRSATAATALAVVLHPGDDLQSNVDASPPGTLFVLRAGTYLGQHVVPKSGDSFVGDSGAVLDGGDTVPYAFDMGPAPHPGGVRIEGLVIQHYAPPVQAGAVRAGGSAAEGRSDGWILSRCEVRYNSGGAGVRIGDRMRLLGNYIHHNEQIGIVGSGDSVLVDGNEIAFNNYMKTVNYLWEAGGTKFVRTHDLVVRNNYVHDNWGPGLWTDIDNLNTLYEGNRVVGNADAGIFHEISYKATIRDNYVQGNGFDRTTWLWGAGILVAASPDVEAYGNVLTGNRNGIAGIQQNRGSGAYGRHLVRNLFVHDNSIDVSLGGRTGIVRDYYTDSLYTSWNNRFARNRYALGLRPRPFAWMDHWRTEAEWLAYGQDSSGTFSR